MGDYHLGCFFQVGTRGGGWAGEERKEVGERDHQHPSGRLLLTSLGRSRSCNVYCLGFLPSVSETLCIISIHPFILPRVSKEDVFFYLAKVHPSTWTIDPILPISSRPLWDQSSPSSGDSLFSPPSRLFPCLQSQAAWIMSPCSAT